MPRPVHRLRILRTERPERVPCPLRSRSRSLSTWRWNGRIPPRGEGRAACRGQMTVAMLGVLFHVLIN
jgi:hypothetical protein